jgi:serine protease Do
VDCRAFDEQVVRRDPKVAHLMDQFVCVRLVQANAMDLAQFQFDYDLTFAVLFLNPDGTVYGRFGSRSDRKDANRDISLEGFREGMTMALELHKNYPANRASLEGKRGPAPRFKTPEEYPSLRGRYKPTLDYEEGKVVQSCLHCHQVRDAERRLFRDEQKPIPDEVLYPWPMPDVVGLALDPKQKAGVASVVAGSAADRAGFRSGDKIVALQGQPILSIADVQWVLHNTDQPASVRAEVRRGRERLDLTLPLDSGWRRKSDISWRATTWDLRRMATGGLVLEEATAVERQNAELPEQSLALRAKHVGQYGEHAVAKRAGFKEGDILVRVDGQTGPMTENELIGYLVQRKRPGDRIPVTVVRAGEQLNLELTMQ